MDKRLEVQC